MSTRTYGKNPNHYNVRFYEFNGERRTIVGWAKKFGLTYECIQSRLKQGTPLDKPKGRGGRPPGSSTMPQGHDPSCAKMPPDSMGGAFACTCGFESTPFGGVDQ